MTPDELKDRTKKFALRVIKLVQSLPKTPEAQVIGKQLLDSATSIGANYRAVCRARSTREFYSKMSIVVEEADESVFWVELLIDSGIMRKELLTDLFQEANEILMIMAKSRKTTKRNQQINKSTNQ